MKKKVIAMLLTTVMVGSILAGCGNSEGASEGENKGKKEGDTIKVMCVGTEADTYIDAYNSIAEKFSEDNEYGVNVEIEYYEMNNIKRN